MQSPTLTKKNALIKRVLKANQEARSKLRGLSALLRPSVLDDVGLKEAIHTYVAEYSSRTGIDTKSILRFNNNDLHPEVTTNLYRIFQEALTNISKHAKAKTVWIDLHSSANQLTMLIKDDGIGFDLNSERMQKSLGLVGMKERAELLGGQFKLMSANGHGTEIAVSFPIAK